MVKIVPMHSFRRGTGKSNMIANLTVLLASAGRRVGLIDTDIQSPSIHILFHLPDDEMSYSLNDYLRGKCRIEQTVQRVTLPPQPTTRGDIFVIPASTEASEISQLLRQGYNMGLLNKGIFDLIEELELDILLMDTHAGLQEETLSSIALADTLAIMLRLDQQDYQGTGIMVEVARRLKVPRVILIVNEVALAFDAAAVKKQIEQTYNCEVAAVLPHAEEVMTLASADIFVLRYPDHPITAALKQVAAKLVL